MWHESLVSSLFFNSMPQGNFNKSLIYPESGFLQKDFWNDWSIKKVLPHFYKLLFIFFFSAKWEFAQVKSINDYRGKYEFII